MRNFKELLVWQKAHRFALDVYGATGAFPGEERFGLTSQHRRSAVSIASNIAEGCGRVGGRELARFVSMAAGSASEAEYQLLLGRDLGYLPATAHVRLDVQANEIKKMLRQWLTANG